MSAMKSPPLEARFRIALTDPPTTLSVGGDVRGLLGYADDDFLSGRTSLRERFHRDDRDIAERLFSATADAAASGTFNLRLRHADGRIRCIKAHYRKRRDRAGATLLLLRLQDAKSLWRHRINTLSAEFKAMMENTDDYIYFKDRNHVFTGASQTTASLAPGCGHWTELLGRTDYDVFPERYADMYHALEKQIFSGSPVAHSVHEIVDQHGTKGWIDNRKYPIRDSKGAITGLFGVARVITREKEVEAALRESEEALRAAQRLAGLGSYVLDLDSGVVHGSEELDRVLGIDDDYPHTAAGWVALVHPDDRAEAFGYFSHDVQIEGKDFDVEYRIIRHADGATRWVRGIGKTECDETGRPLRLRGSIQDVTEHREEAMAEQRAILGNRMIGVAAVRDDRVAWANEAFETMLGYDKGELSGVPTRRIYVDDAAYARDKAASRDLTRSEIVHTEREFQCKDGRRLWAAKAAALLQRTGPAREYLWTCIDITQRKQDEQRLQLAASVFATANEGIMITAPDGAIVDVNDAFTCITGYRRDEVLGENPRFLKSGRHGRDFYIEMWRELTAKQHWYGEIWNRRKSGEIYPETLSIAAVRDAHGVTRHYVGVFSDISAIKERERQLEHIAHYDALTNLPNRVLLADRLQHAMFQALRRGQSLAVAYLDLDGFKAINDAYGHATGDRLLVGITDHLRQSLREGDTLARIGGDEFVAVLCDLEDQAASFTPLSRLLAAAARPVRLDERTLQISASLGVTFYPQPEAIDADQLLRQADQAMYQAKLAGKNHYHLFDAEHDRSVRGHHESLDRIRLALVRDEFVLHYQPKVNMRTGDVLGVEALIRWQHPEHGLSSPAMFLPAVENHPLAIAIGEWVIDAALNQMERWQDAGLTLPVSVNVSGHHLQQPDFVAHLRGALARHDRIAPGLLSLEVLETSALEDIAHATETMEACRGLGVACALDDFGTGYSSLTYLKRLPVSVLKIDQSFVRDMLDDPDDLAILDGVIGLAAAFRRDVIAEGVETVEQGELLLQFGCELGQGYGIARPMPPERIPDWVGHWQPADSWREQPPIQRENLPLIFAGVEHLSWVAALERRIADGHAPAPPLDSQQCLFGHWLATEAPHRWLSPTVYDEIDAMHHRLHALAAELLALRAHGDTSAADARLFKLRDLSNGLFARLRQLAAGAAGPARQRRTAKR